MHAWRTAYNTAIGTAHLRNGTECQDAGACTVHQGEILVACVADGAGSAPLSRQGAELAVTSFQSHFATAATADPTLATLDRSFVLAWLAETQTTLSQQDAPARDYACTFLGAVLTPAAALYVQIGDGAIVAADGDSYRAIFWPQHGEFANSTYFLTMEEAADIIQIEHSTPPDQLALFTDGLERLVLDMTAHTVHAPALNPIFTWLATTEPSDGTPSPVLATYLNSPNVNRRTDDDKTLVMATNRPPA